VFDSLFRGMWRLTGVAATPAHAPRPKSTAWHAVSVVAGSQACDGARKCGPHRFLSAQAPLLPLPGCDSRTCECRYRHHPDRRARSRRQTDRHPIGRHYVGTEQRVVARGRRAGDA
jgi:hypothetical protein